MEGQDSIFGSENSVGPTQNSSQTQHAEPEKLDDSIDNQQQVCVALWPVPKTVDFFYLFIFFNFELCLGK